MRRNFAQILRSAKVDYKKEYKKLYNMLFAEKTDDYGNFCSNYTLLSGAFTDFFFHGTYLSLEEFDEDNGISFPDPSIDDPSLEDLVLLMEYFYNMLMGYYISYPDGGFESQINTRFIMKHIENVGGTIGYKLVYDNNLYIFVEKDSTVTAVAESDLIPDNLSYRLITYDHHSMRGDLESKKSIILQLAGILEGKQKELNQVNPTLKKDLFYIFNNLNLRHNNCDSQSKNYKHAVADMGEEVLENWYDETYRMCLLAFMELEHAGRKPEFDKLKATIENA